MKMICNLLAFAAILAAIGIMAELPYLITIANIPFFGAALVALIHIALGFYD